jgi:hypothetical protein
MFSLCPTCTHRCELPKILTNYKVGVEVGVLHGRYAMSILNQWPGIMHLIDPWEPYPEYIDVPQDHKHNLREAVKNLLPFKDRMKIWRRYNGTNVANRIGKVDFAYIDGNHAFKYVMEDIRIWWDHINSGGILAGHDLFQIVHPGVTQAIILFAHERDREIFMIPGKDGCECGEGGVPSWYIRKD